MTTLSFPSSVKAELLSLAQTNHYTQALDILNRGKDDELILNNLEEAQAVVDTARIKLLDTQLRFPFWDDTADNHNEAHEEAFQEVQMGIFEKTVSYISQEFKIRSST